MPADVDGLTIHSWRFDWLVAIERGGDSLAARSMADDVAAALPARLRQLSVTVPGDEADAIVFIDRLVLDVDVGAAWDRDALIDEIARSLGHDLGRRLAVEPSGGGVVRYRDRTELVAQFLVNLAAGRAFERWWYTEFEGLRALPPSAALRTLAEASPATWLEALGRLDDSALAGVLRVIGEVDARRILGCYREGEVGRGVIPDLGALEIVWAIIETGSGFPLPGPGGGESLRLFARAARLRSELTAAALVGAIDALGDLVDAAWAGEDGGGWPPVASAPPERWAALRARVLAVSPSGDPSARPRGWDARPTPFGGALMLLGVLDECRAGLGIDFGALPPPPVEAQGEGASSGAGADVYRLLLVACAHGDRWGAVFDDPCLRDLLAVPPTLDLQAAHDWAEGLPASLHALLRLESVAADLDARAVPHWRRDGERVGDEGHFPAPACPALRAGAAALLRAFAARLPGFQASSPPFLRERFLACAAAVDRDVGSSSAFVARLEAAPLDLVLRMTRLKSLGFDAGAGRGRVTLREGTA